MWLWFAKLATRCCWDERNLLLLENSVALGLSHSGYRLWTRPCTESNSAQGFLVFELFEPGTDLRITVVYLAAELIRFLTVKDLEDRLVPQVRFVFALVVASGTTAGVRSVGREASAAADVCSSANLPKAGTATRSSTEGAAFCLTSQRPKVSFHLLFFLLRHMHASRQGKCSFILRFASHVSAVVAMPDMEAYATYGTRRNSFLCEQVDSLFCSAGTLQEATKT